MDSSNSVERQVAGAPAHFTRLMSAEDVPEVLDIWKSVDLHEGTHTIQSFLKVDPNGFFVSVHEETGKILGMCAAVFVSEEVAFVGLYGMKPEFQGLGLGVELWSHCMEHIGQRNAGLYAVPSQLATYRDKAGFAVQDTTRMLVFESNAPLDGSDLVQSLGNVELESLDGQEALQKAVVAYDEKVLYYSRDKLLNETFKEEGALVLVAKDKFDDQVLGYGCFRTNNVGKAMAGPVYADNDAVAELIVSWAIKNFPPAKESGLLYMVLTSNPGGVRIAEKLKLELHEDLPRFFTKKVPKADLERIYCIHTPNFSPF